MADIRLVRVDFRLIHGQVVLKWCNQVDANRIMIINDELAEDSFMSSIYVMAAPKKTSVQIYSVETALEEWKKDQFGDGRLLILFKDVGSLKKSYDAGLPLTSVQIGGLGGGPGRVNVHNAISFDGNDVEMLEEMEQRGCEIYLQIIPEHSKTPLQKAVEKFKK